MDQNNMQPPVQKFVDINAATPLATPLSVPEMLTAYECQLLVEWFEENSEYHQDGLINDPEAEGGMDETMRKVTVMGVPADHPGLDDEIRNIFGKLFWSIQQLNSETYQFTIDEFQIGQILRYDEGCFYESHSDTEYMSGARCRKLSAIVQLSEEEDYEGGDILFQNQSSLNSEVPEDKRSTPSTKEQGSMILFPSFLTHKVTKVEKGSRYAVVFWVTGPKFK